MPLLAHALFYFAYALVALATGLALSRIGGADGVSSVLGGLGLFASFAVSHAAFVAALASGAIGRVEKRLKVEIAAIKADQIETKAETAALAERIDQVQESVEQVAQRRAEPPTEVKALEKLVDRLGRTLEARFEDMRRLTGPTTAAADKDPFEMVREALKEHRAELHLQPIVSLPQRRTAFYEGFTRLKAADGRVMLPSEFIPAAEAMGALTTIDNALLFRCVQIVRKLAKQDRRIGIFCNIAPRSLSDEQFFPHFLDFMHENRDLAGALIFELPQAAFEARTSVEARAMGRLADLGFRFSLDKATKLDLDLIDLERAGVRFFKANATDIIEQYGRQGLRPRSNIAREVAARDVAAVFRRYGIDLIAERVETEEVVLELLDLELPFAQGHLFGAPRPLKESLMEETAPPPAVFGRGSSAGA